MTWWLWAIVGCAIFAAQLVATLAVCRVAALEDEAVARWRRRELELTRWRMRELELARSRGHELDEAGRARNVR